MRRIPNWMGSCSRPAGIGRLLCMVIDGHYAGLVLSLSENTRLRIGLPDVRNLQLYLNPFAEHVLDGFHITMRLTVLGQLAKGAVLRTEVKDKKKKKRPQIKEEEPESYMLTLEEWNHQLERIKWYLWHGNVFHALQIGETLQEDLEVLDKWHPGMAEPSISNKQEKAA